jgi:hypothetical protein
LGAFCASSVSVLRLGRRKLLCKSLHRQSK